MDSGPVLWAVGLSVLCASVAVAISIVPATAVALLLARRRFAGKAGVELAVMAPLVLPPVVVGYVLLRLLSPAGPIGATLNWLGVSLLFTWAGAAVAQAVVVFPLMVLTIRAAVSGVDPDLESAAKVMGAGPGRIFFSVTLPLAWPGIAAGCVLGFARALGEFGATILVAGNMPGRTRTLPLAIFTSVQSPGRGTQTLILSLIAVSVSVAAVLLHRGLTRGRDRG